MPSQLPAHLSSSRRDPDPPEVLPSVFYYPPLAPAHISTDGRPLLLQILPTPDRPSFTGMGQPTVFRVTNSNHLPLEQTHESPRIKSSLRSLYLHLSLLSMIRPPSGFAGRPNAQRNRPSINSKLQNSKPRTNTLIPPRFCAGHRQTPCSIM